MELGQQQDSGHQSQVPSPAGNLSHSFPDPQWDGHTGEGNSPPNSTGEGGWGWWHQHSSFPTSKRYLGEAEPTEIQPVNPKCSKKKSLF